MLGFTIPTWLALPALGLAGVLLVYSLSETFRHVWGLAKKRGHKMAPLILIAVATITLVGGIIWLMFDKNIINMQDFEKETTELSGLSNAQLRLKSMESARALRKYEIDRPQYNINFRLDYRTATIEEIAKDREERLKIITDQDKEYYINFMNNYRSDLIILRKELRIRLKAAGVYKTDRDYYQGMVAPDGKDIVLDLGAASAPRALSQLADMFDNMGRALP